MFLLGIALVLTSALAFGLPRQTPVPGGPKLELNERFDLTITRVRSVTFADEVDPTLRACWKLRCGTVAQLFPAR